MNDINTRSFQFNLNISLLCVKLQNNILKRFVDHFQHLGNYTPTPPTNQQQKTDDQFGVKVGLGEGRGKGAVAYVLIRYYSLFLLYRTSQQKQ